MKISSPISLILLCLLMGSCGAFVPKINEVWDKDIPPAPKLKRTGLSAEAQIEFEIKRKIYCELERAVQNVEKIPVSIRPKGKKTFYKDNFIPLDWGAQISIYLQVEENTALNPGISLNEPRATAMSYFTGLLPVSTPQSFTLGLGGTLSATATRVDKFDAFYSISYLNDPNTQDDVCDDKNDPILKAGYRPANSSPFIIDSDLGIESWLQSAMFVNRSIPSYSADNKLSEFAPPSGYQPDTVSIEIKFVIVTSGSVQPTWRLVRLSANTGSSPLFATGRTRTHDVIITIGPAKTATLNSHLALQIAQAVNASR